MASGFDHFYSSWLDQLPQLVHQLSAAAPKPPNDASSHHIDAAAAGAADSRDHDHLTHLVNKFMSHYAEYYRVKALATEQDVLSVVAAPWTTALERSLHWIAGWRPTMVFHLVYTESSILFESHIVDILQGVRTGDLGDLSPTQFRRVSELQCDTVREENAITEEMSQWQDGALELVVAAAAPDMEAKIGQLAAVVKKADDLRLKTVRSVVDLLTPQQAAEFLVAAAELQFGIRAWGLCQEGSR
ncbi:protein DOG1-like 4 [Punica granatum]|uniref:DOG1 domain-containing protein n=2 Tax=Punica granatum TaxID=22663 RepID=A0A218X916_PUNGR|nr:protein DOG1-like 4 [Punica granatum]OWM81447.1 hypothetical protein CDL15_Pgr007485 [Punica granatum]PKI33032.1 hypothetical protein CRG98_046574 [Punica granatum]